MGLQCQKIARQFAILRSNHQTNWQHCEEANTYKAVQKAYINKSKMNLTTGEKCCFRELHVKLQGWSLYWEQTMKTCCALALYAMAYRAPKFGENIFAIAKHLSPAILLFVPLQRSAWTRRYFIGRFLGCGECLSWTRWWQGPFSSSCTHSKRKWAFSGNQRNNDFKRGWFSTSGFAKSGNIRVLYRTYKPRFFHEWYGNAYH